MFPNKSIKVSKLRVSVLINVPINFDANDTRTSASL